MEPPEIACDRLARSVYLLPNLVTSGGLFSGFYSIVCTIDGQFQLAAWMILLAAVFDTLDGKVARLTGTTSQFGVEYDSLSDLVAFGIAPGLLMYLWALEPFGRWGWLAAFLYVACGALRLARFNVQVEFVEAKRFVGLPIPAAACLVASGVIVFFHLGGSGPVQKLSLLVLVYGLAFLMISSLRYFSMKDQALFNRQPFSLLMLCIIVGAVVFAEPEIMLFAAFLTYALSGPVVVLWRLGRAQNRRHQAGWLAKVVSYAQKKGG